ncbi:hypothetical protein HNQ91_001944 [Filimonas zeae]|uniref:GAF domain-containing protein n=1 Tax=Filimonas zeae TaxID=1737353 RepID=A0A917MX52_9BACT|nr:GAF domain-containing protein [Filimonas zeae]MDR6338893.1 hypothetical protein [Filimonas zeae]GGH66089.1 hypothetical protein GCM10011379_19900 [Filimonas zeae]
MKTKLLNLAQGSDYQALYTLDTELSFRPFIRFLEQKIQEEHTARAAIFKAALDAFARYPELQDPITVTDPEKYKAVLEQIFTILTPVTEPESSYLWALCLPMAPTVFYCTNAFYDLLTVACDDADICSLKPNLIQHTEEDWRQQKLTHTYSIILSKLYGIPFGHKDIIHKTIDEGTGLARYYRLDFDDRFINIKTSKPLPELTMESIQEQLPPTSNPLSVLESKLPLNLFTFEGFSVITLTEVTEEHAVETLRDIVVEHAQNSDERNFERIELALKSMIGNPAISFGLLPLLKINNRYVFKNGIGLKSTLIDLARQHGFGEEMFQGFVRSYVTAPRIVFLRSITPLHQDLSPALKILAEHNILSFVIIPMYYQGKLCGVLEVFSDQENIINEKMLSRLNAANLVLSQVLQQSIDDLQTEIARVITDKFTPLQPAVQWKFNEAAWEYLVQEQEQEAPRLPRIAFEDVYPLYGAVDIRNSTEERNTALKADLETHLHLLETTMQAIQQCDTCLVNEESVKKHKEWQQKIVNSHNMSPYQAMKLEDYLHREIPALLQSVRQNNPGASGLIDHYLQAINPKDGATFQHRRELENSMQLINVTIGKTLDQFNSTLQEEFPCYFEKFRTDGVEYDIYTGPSIDPTRTFDHNSLKKIRHRQLEVMALMAQQTKALLPLMPKALLTTQLIFVHGTHIDIAFRADEKRFDVEGSYNIRYQVVKKRIDKAFIKNTAQRLTQPGTIAIVYSGKQEIEDYLEGIQSLQQAGTLSQELEWLELEELQGLTGMKALRVQVLGGVTLA